MDKERAQYLLDRFHTNTCTVDERVEFVLFLHDPGFEQLREEYFNGQWPEVIDEELSVPVRSEEILTEIQGAERPFNWSAFRIWQPYLAAAIFAVVLGFGIWWATGYHNAAIVDNTIAEDVQPGGNKATLTLANGKKIELRKDQSEIVLGQELKYSDGSKVKDASLEDQHSQNLILSVPKGGIYSIVLSDGTKVWLNSASKLKYPLHFVGVERVVELDGEAYFHVSTIHVEINGKKAKLPFVVKTSKQAVQVLGTQFNLSAYPDEPTSTTLIEGKVNVTTAKEKRMLAPGQQTLLRGTDLHLAKVDVRKFTAWKNGYFDFTDMKLVDVMRQLSRWYGIEVNYQGSIPDMEFYGSMERDNKLSTVLTLLEINDLGYTLEGKKLTIYHKLK